MTHGGRASYHRASALIRLETKSRVIDSHVLFVKTEDTEKFVIQTVKTKVFANSPNIFIVSGILSAAEVVRKCEATLTPLLSEYKLERMSSGQKENLFYKRSLF